MGAALRVTYKISVIYKTRVIRITCGLGDDFIVEFAFVHNYLNYYREYERV